MDGKDLHVGDLGWGILPAAAPLDHRDADHRGHGDGVLRATARRRVAVSFIGEGGSSLGEWHEAINLCAARRLPAIFCVAEQSDGALDAGQRAVGGARVRRQGRRLRHPRHHPRRHRSGRDRRGLCLGRRTGARRRSVRRSSSSSPCGCAATRITTTCSISASDPQPSWDYPRSSAISGYVDRELYAYWARRDPIAHLRGTPRGGRRASAARDLDDCKRRSRRAGRGAKRARSSTRHGPTPEQAGDRRVRRRGAAHARSSRSIRSRRLHAGRLDRRCRRSMPARRSIRKARTLLEAIALGVGDALRADPRVFVFGEDVGGKYGNAFLLLRPLLEDSRRSHHQLAAGRRRGARRLRRRGARRPAADRRNAVQRLRRHRLQSARQQRREDPLSLGRRRADGRADAVGRSAPRGSVPFAEHRALVLSHARA